MVRHLSHVAPLSYPFEFPKPPSYVRVRWRTRIEHGLRALAVLVYRRRTGLVVIRVVYLQLGKRQITKFILQICNHRSRHVVALLCAEPCLHHIHKNPTWLCASCQPQTRLRLAKTPTLSLLLLLLYVLRVVSSKLLYCTRAGGMRWVKHKGRQFDLREGCARLF